jgi:hypothetical protein
MYTVLLTQAAQDALDHIVEYILVKARSLSRYQTSRRFGLSSAKYRRQPVRCIAGSEPRSANLITGKLSFRDCHSLLFAPIQKRIGFDALNESTTFQGCFV